MAQVGSRRSGKALWLMRRISTNTSTSGQNSSPTPNCAAAHVGAPSATPASGATTLPTTGMNSTGVMDGHKAPAPPGMGASQRPSTHRVAHHCSRLPSHQRPRMAGPPNPRAWARVASNNRDTGTVATKACRTGCFRSSSSASGWCCHRTSEATASTPKVSTANPPTTSATPCAMSPSSGLADRQASASPTSPMTSENQPGCRNLSGAGVVMTGPRWQMAPEAPRHTAVRS